MWKGKVNYFLNFVVIQALDFSFLCAFLLGIHFHFPLAPSLPQSLYSESVPEDSPAGRLILQVSATDADIRSNAQISYELKGVGSELFTIDSDTGMYLCVNRNRCKKEWICIDHVIMWYIYGWYICLFFLSEAFFSPQLLS